MTKMLLPAAFLLLTGAQLALAYPTKDCKCVPGDSCWPDLSKWNALNNTLSGKLIHNNPRAQVCYPGSDYNEDECQFVNDQWGNSSIIGITPTGYSYPLHVGCAPINTTISSYPVCQLGSAPAYTVNATTPEDVAVGIKFAHENNIRLSIKNTGHDMVGR